jgi:hypothetical protein
VSAEVALLPLICVKSDSRTCDQESGWKLEVMMAAIYCKIAAFLLPLCVGTQDGKPGNTLFKNKPDATSTRVCRPASGF